MSAPATAYERVLDRLHENALKVHVRGGRARSQCPVHGSRGLTLAVSQRDDSAGVYCHAGCATKDVLGVLGLVMRDLFDDNGDDWKRPHGWKPRLAPNPLGDPAHFCDRAMQQQRLEADPGWQARREAERADLGPRPGDHPGGPVAWDGGGRRG